MFGKCGHTLYCLYCDRHHGILSPGPTGPHAANSCGTLKLSTTSQNSPSQVAGKIFGRCSDANGLHLTPSAIDVREQDSIYFSGTGRLGNRQLVVFGISAHSKVNIEQTRTKNHNQVLYRLWLPEPGTNASTVNTLLLPPDASTLWSVVDLKLRSPNDEVAGSCFARSPPELCPGMSQKRLAKNSLSAPSPETSYTGSDEQGGAHLSIFGAHPAYALVGSRSVFHCSSRPKALLYRYDHTNCCPGKEAHA